MFGKILHGITRVDHLILKVSEELILRKVYAKKLPTRIAF